MKEIGQMLKDAREKNGVTTIEAASDLNLKVSLIEQIEEGNLDSFKDVHYLKEFIKNYCKYLGLDGDKILDDFNEFIFDHTSRIPIENIDTGKKEIKADKVVSPYTSDAKICFTPLALFTILGVIILVVIALIIGISLKLF